MTASLTEHEATELAGRIINTLRPTPPMTDWVEELTGKHRDRAWRTFRTLRATSENGLTIARFMRTYLDDLKAEREERGIGAAPPHCELCGGSGWTDATPIEAHRPTVCRGTPGTERGTGGCWCSAALPCRCTTGQARHATHANILARNAAP